MKTFEELKSEFEPKLNELLLNKSVNHVKLGEGTVKYIEARLSKEADCFVTVTFADNTEKTFYGYFVVNKGFLQVSDEVKEVLNNYHTECSEIWAEKVKQEKEALEKLRQEEEAKKAEQVRLKKEADIKKRFDNELIKVNHLQKVSSNTDNFFTALGWLAKHGRTLSAAMPDIIEPWFIRQFGDVKRTVVDSKKRTINGFPMQWALSLTLTVDDENMIPMNFCKYKSAQKNKIANTEFLFTLASDYNFQFGTKKQDIDKIRETIPESQLDAFDLGVAM